MHIKTEDGHTHEVNSIDHIRFKELPGGTWQVRIYPRFGQHREGLIRSRLGTCLKPFACPVGPHFAAPASRATLELRDP